MEPEPEADTSIPPPSGDTISAPPPVGFSEIGTTAEVMGTTDEDGVLRRDDGIIQAVSMCTECEENGMTTFLPTVIPHFKKVIVSSFRCEHCGHRNSELQIADYEEKGCRYQLKVEGQESLNRQIVKSDRATIVIPELDFEIPATPEAKSVITTLEGLLTQHIENLEAGQPVRRIMDEATADKIDAFLVKLKKCAEGERAFTLIIRDPSGNSYVENPLAPKPDPNLTTVFFSRSQEDNELLGINHDGHYKPENDNTLDVQGGEELAQFPELCYACGSSGLLKMVVTTIPHFKEIVLMCFTCDACGYKTVDVKPGGEVCDQGVQFELSVGDEGRDAKIDLSRDVIKSADAEIMVPEIELELAPGTLGGLFTTVEGLLSQTRDHLTQSNPLAFTIGDAKTGGTQGSGGSDDVSKAEESKARAAKSVDASDAAKKLGGAYGKFIEKLTMCIEGRMQFTFILRDATGNSYVQALDELDQGWGVLGSESTANTAARDHESYVQHGMQKPTEAGEDPRLVRSYFERTALEDDELGLADMRTEWVDGEYRAPAGVKQRDPEELRAAAEARRQAMEAKGAYAGASGPAGGGRRRARASHILVADEALCLEIKSQLDSMVDADATAVAGRFSSLASEHSTCPSSGQGGLLGTFAPGKMVPAFDAVIFGQPAPAEAGDVGTQDAGGEVGVVHGPVKTQFGYHLIFIHERQ